MKTAKKIASLFFVLALFASMLAVGASAYTELKPIGTGDANATYQFRVDTSSRKESHYLKLKQTKGTAPYKDFLSYLKDVDTTKDAKMYGKYAINVYNANGEQVTSYTWNCSLTSKKISLGQRNSTYYIEVVPYAVRDVFCSYIDKGLFKLNGLRYMTECVNYDGGWTSAPTWSVKTIQGAEIVG